MRAWMEAPHDLGVRKGFGRVRVAFKEGKEEYVNMYCIALSRFPAEVAADAERGGRPGEGYLV